MFFVLSMLHGVQAVPLIGAPLIGLLITKVIMPRLEMPLHTRKKQAFGCLTYALFAWPINDRERQFYASEDETLIYIENTQGERFVRCSEDGYIEKISPPGYLSEGGTYTVVVSHCSPNCRTHGLKTIYGGLSRIDPGIKTGQRVRQYTILGELEDGQDLIFRIIDAGKPITNPADYLARNYPHK